MMMMLSFVVFLFVSVFLFLTDGTCITSLNQYPSIATVLTQPLEIFTLFNYRPKFPPDMLERHNKVTCLTSHFVS